MEVNPGNSDKNSSKTNLEEDKLKIPIEDSSKDLQVKDIIKNSNDNNTTSLKIEEVNKEILFYSTSQLNTDPKKICPSKSRYPYCIVWTPIPFLTYILPCIGHTGIANSKGIIHDFAASYFVSIDDFNFGKPTKYVQLDLNDKEKHEYDKAIEKGDLKYRTLVHNLFTNNCHSHVAYVLNQMKYKGKSNYNMVDIWWILIMKGKYIDFWAFVKTYLGFFIFLLIIAFAIK